LRHRPTCLPLVSLARGSWTIVHFTRSPPNQCQNVSTNRSARSQRARIILSRGGNGGNGRSGNTCSAPTGPSSFACSFAYCNCDVCTPCTPSQP